MKKQSYGQKKWQNCDIEEEVKLPLFSESVVECTDFIEEMLEKVPDKRTKEYRKWKEDLNKVIEHVNKISKTKIYSKL